MKIILLVLSLTVLSFAIIAQCHNNVSTDYNQTPTNNALPANPPQPSYGAKFLNKFNWMPKSGNQTLEKYETINISQNILDAGEIQNIYSNQQNPFYSYLYNDLEPNPKNGWELISVNLGYFPNGDVQSPSSDYQDFPYLILYNKYKSILRVFGVLGSGYADAGGPQSIDAVVVKLLIEKEDESTSFNGLLRRSEGSDRSLDQETDFYKMASVTKHQDQKGKWFSADFQIAYDPCVCYYDSRLRFMFDFVETATDFQAQINSIALEDDLIDNNTGMVDADFLNNFNYTNTDEEGEYDASNGYIIHDAMDNLLNNYIDELKHYEDSLDAIGEHNKQVTRRKFIAMAGKYVLKAGTFLITGGSNAALELQSLAHIFPDLMDNIGKISKDIIPELQKVLGLGTEMLISEWVGEEIEPSDYPETPVRPTVTFTQSTMRGTIQRTVKDYAGPMIRTPGSYGGIYTGSNEDITTPHEYPVYNEALGVFALLESPKLIISNHIEDFKCESELAYINGEPGQGNGVYYHYNTREYKYITQFKLQEELKYLLNPALNIKKYSIDASFLTDGMINNTNPLYEVINTNETVNVESTSFNVDLEDTLSHSLDVSFNSIYLPINVLSNFVFGVGVKKTAPEYIAEDDCDSFDQYLELVQNNISEEEFQVLIIKDVYLKLLINVTYEGEKSDGSPHEYTYMFTYKIDENDLEWENNNPLYPNLAGSPGDILQYPENLFLDGVNFDGSQVEGCQLNGTTYTCNAWNEITLSGDFTVSSGYNVIIDAGSKITELPEAAIPAEMVRQITILDYSNPMPPVDETYVTNFCSIEGAYKANIQPSEMNPFNNDSTTVYEEDRRDIFAFNIFPNPTSGSSTVSITLNESAKGELFITDMNGRTLATAFKGQTLRGGKTEHQLPTASLASGIYLVHLFIDGERHVKRLVKQ